MRVLLLSTYELGHQPLGLARPAADLTAAGHEVRCLDLSVDRLDETLVGWAELVGISVPMHTATRLGARLAERVRAINPGAHITFYGLYASLHADVLVGRLADSAIGGEYEGPLVALADALTEQRQGRGRLLPIPGVRAADHDGGVYLGRQTFRLPRRDLLPPLDRYAQVDLGTRQKLAGYVEASRGCAHRCLHCPITPVYGGRLRIVERDVVLEDIEQLVRLGAEHITFGDPDFFNGIKHSLRIVEALHAAFPGLTYDVTIKVEHLLEHRQHLGTLARTGCLFIVSAVEAVHDHVLTYLDKGHSAADVDTALKLAAEVRLPLRPTFVPFTPWLDLDGYLELLAFVRGRGLIGHIDPVQFAIRLLVPRGSSLYGTPGLAPYVGDFDAETFSYRWSHPDPRMDQLQREVAALVEQAGCAGDPAEQTFTAIERLALVAAGREALTPRSPRAAQRPGGEGFLALPTAAFVPRLTETWFC
jgi:radical SAM superfamily enzyme YgiQ (UPF0313 family)